ncbi:hypothetical protein [Schauerella aestuarii]|uniref:hypothetical protein n=1 Tax=Schauerella aestuarii TaxID=2511204 RepID=UPI0013700290|nr:hypothetical protein [Achromobacter aestuarii]MYZ43308.1 hypothetical protein [Achromobacter aestuarii]
MRIKQGCVVLLGCTLGAAAFAQEAVAPVVAPSTSPDFRRITPEWSGSVTVYGWFAGVRGDTRLGRLPTASVNTSFSDIARVLDFGAMGIVEARRGRFGFVGETIYVKVSDRATGRFGEVTAKVRLEDFVGLAAGSYRAMEGDWGTLDLLAGARVFSLKSTVSFSTPAAFPNYSNSRTKTWVDATVGAKTRLDLNEKWFVTMWGLVGAGGSKYDWDVLTAVGYQFDKRWSVSAGYRAIGVDYQSSDFGYRMIQHGPMLGLTARF